MHYPAYQVWRENSAFPNAEALHAYEQALEQAAALDDALEVNLGFRLRVRATPLLGRNNVPFMGTT